MTVLVDSLGDVTQCPNKPRVYLVDSSNYVFRAWQRRPKTLVDRHGALVNALTGFADFVRDVLAYTQAQRIGFAFDVTQRHSFRKALFPAYKAHRASPPDGLRQQFRRCQTMLTLLGMDVVTSDACEADDVLATLAREQREQGAAITVITGDKDLVQLLRNRSDLWWDFAVNRQLSARAVKRRFGVGPALFADAQALAGDKSDGVPGIPGVGLASAGRILEFGGSLDAVLADPAMLTQTKLRNARVFARLIEQHRETILVARRLVTLVDRIPLEPMPTLLRRRPDPTAFGGFVDEITGDGDERARWFKLLDIAQTTYRD